MLGGLFAPTLLDWLFGAGIGTNIGAALVWVPIGAALGVLWSKTSYWPLHAIHSRFDAIEESHRELHRKLDGIVAPDGPDHPRRPA